MDNIPNDLAASEMFEKAEERPPDDDRVRFVGRPFLPVSAAIYEVSKLHVVSREIYGASGVVVRSIWYPLGIYRLAS